MCTVYTYIMFTFTISNMEAVAAGMILFSQISKGFIQLPENAVIMLKFNDVRMMTLYMIHCIYLIYTFRSERQ